MRLGLVLALVVACDSGGPKPGSEESARWVSQLGSPAHGELVRVAGTIAKPITRAGDAVMFGLAHDGVQVHVVHRGVLPDRFKVASEAAVVGHWLAGDDARGALIEHGFAASAAGEVFVARDVFAYGPRF